MAVDLPPQEALSVANAFEHLCESAKEFKEEGLIEKKVCRAVYPKCMKEQQIAAKVMKDVGALFLALSQNHAKLIDSIDKELEKQVSDKKLIGVVSIEPKAIFSLEMFLRLQEDNDKHKLEAVKTYKAFIKLMEDLNAQRMESMLSYDVFIGDLKAFSMTLMK